MSTEKIMGFIIVLVVGLSMTTVIKSACDDAIQGTPIYHTSATVNSAFSDNTGDVPDNWENYVDTVSADNVLRGIINAWNTSGYVTATRVDNGLATSENQENSYWYQSFTLADVDDGITTATVNYRYRVIENDNAADITIEILLDNGTDNTRLFYDNVTGDKSTSWTTRENNVMDNITGIGTYTIWLVTRMTPIDSAAEIGVSNMQVGWDDVNITVTTAEDNPMTGAPKAMLLLVPLFYVVGLLLVAVNWVSKGFKK